MKIKKYYLKYRNFIHVCWASSEAKAKRKALAVMEFKGMFLRRKDDFTIITQPEYYEERKKSSTFE